MSIHTEHQISYKNINFLVIACLLGYTFWYILTDTTIQNITIDAALHFHNIPPDHQLEAPAMVALSVRGTRSTLRWITLDPPSIHLSAQSLTLGTNRIRLSNETIMLPAAVKLICYWPDPLTLNLTTDNYEQ